MHTVAAVALPRCKRELPMRMLHSQSVLQARRLCCAHPASRADGSWIAPRLCARLLQALEDVYEDDTHVHMVLEYCKGGELHHRIGETVYSGACRRAATREAERQRSLWTGGTARRAVQPPQSVRNARGHQAEDFAYPGVAG